MSAATKKALVLSGGGTAGAAWMLGLVTINGRRYADGGARSLYNADLAAGHDVVIVISPIPLNEYLQSKLDSELAELGAATVRVIVADEASIAAIGPDPLSAAAVLAALAAGTAQAKREIGAMRSVWHARYTRRAEVARRRGAAWAGAWRLGPRAGPSAG
jgi:hypothetical protein